MIDFKISEEDDRLTLGMKALLILKELEIINSHKNEFEEELIKINNVLKLKENKK